MPLLGDGRKTPFWPTPLWSVIWFGLAAALTYFGLSALHIMEMELPWLLITVAEVAAAVTILAVFLTSRMFPRVVFEIGFSKRRGDSAKLWRMTVGSVLGLGIVAGVIAGLIVEYIKP